MPVSKIRITYWWATGKSDSFTVDAPYDWESMSGQARRAWAIRKLAKKNSKHRYWFFEVEK